MKVNGSTDILTIIVIIASSIKDLFSLTGAYHAPVPFSSVECTNPSYPSRESFHPVPNSLPLYWTLDC